jgi:hypothetical protein
VKNDTTWRNFIYDEGAKNVKSTAIPPEFWLMSPNCALQTRYSPTHTVKTQIYGKTKYFLFPPDEIKNFYLYPSIHVSEKQSQANLYTELKIAVNGEESDFPNIQSIKSGIEVVLSPGESLYIPPYWMVMTENGPQLGVGIDVHSPSKEQLILLEAYSMVLPFANITQASPAQKILSSQVCQICSRHVFCHTMIFL